MKKKHHLKLRFHILCFGPPIPLHHPPTHGFLPCLNAYKVIPCTVNQSAWQYQLSTLPQNPPSGKKYGGGVSENLRFCGRG